MKVLDLRRNKEEPGTVIPFEKGDVIMFPDGHNFRVGACMQLKVISAEEAQAAYDAATHGGG